MSTRGRATASPLSGSRLGRGGSRSFACCCERGADVQLTDSFYSSRAIDFAIRGGHADVALFLLSRGSKGAAGALNFGIRTKNVAMVEAALATDEIDAAGLSSASAFADRQGGPDIAALVKKAAAAKPAVAPPAIALDPSALASFEGRYINPATGAVVTAAIENRALRLTAPGEATLDLEAVEARQFRASNVPEHHGGVRRTRRPGRSDDHQPRLDGGSLRARRVCGRDLSRGARRRACAIAFKLRQDRDRAEAPPARPRVRGRRFAAPTPTAPPMVKAPSPIGTSRPAATSAGRRRSLVSRPRVPSSGATASSSSPRRATPTRRSGPDSTATSRR